MEKLERVIGNGTMNDIMVAVNATATAQGRKLDEVGAQVRLQVSVIEAQVRAAERAARESAEVLQERFSSGLAAMQTELDRVVHDLDRVMLQQVGVSLPHAGPRTDPVEAEGGHGAEDAATPTFAFLEDSEGEAARGSCRLAWWALSRAFQPSPRARVHSTDERVRSATSSSVSSTPSSTPRLTDAELREFGYPFDFG